MRTSLLLLAQLLFIRPRNPSRRQRRGLRRRRASLIRFMGPTRVPPAQHLNQQQRSTYRTTSHFGILSIDRAGLVNWSPTGHHTSYDLSPSSR